MRNLTFEDLHKFKPQIARWSFWRKVRNPLAGLSFFKRCSDDSVLIVCRHWPHLLCWSWSVSFDARRKWGMSWSAKYKGAFFGPFQLSWQNYDWMIACGPIREDALKHIAGQLGVEYESYLTT